MQALPCTLHSPPLFEFLLLNLPSTKNQDAISRRISSDCKGELPVIDVGGLGLDDLIGKNVIICQQFCGDSSCEARDCERTVCLFSVVADLIHMKWRQCLSNQG